MYVNVPVPWIRHGNRDATGILIRKFELFVSPLRIQICPKNPGFPPIIL